MPETLGNYNIIKQLGTGAMGDVLLAEHRLLRVKRALKLLKRELSKQPGFRRRFMEEGQMLASLHHRNIVAVHDMEIQGDDVFIAMDFVTMDGETSQSLESYAAARGGKLPSNEVCAIISQISEAIIYAHNKGVIHRDIKPSNILMAENGAIKVSDFGLAKIIGAEIQQKKPEEELGIADSIPDGGASSLATPRESIIGTFHYMPPEVQRGGEWTKSGDIYSMGVVAYYLLTGAHPVGRWKLPSSIIEGLSLEWDKLISKAMEVNPTDRHVSVEEFYEELKLLRASSGKAATEEPVEKIIKTYQTEPKPSVSPAKKGGCFWKIVLLLMLLGLAKLWLSEEDVIITQTLPATPTPTPVDLFEKVSLMAKADKAYGQERYDEARDLYRKILKMDPIDSHSNIFLGWCYIQLLKYDEALKSFKRALEIDPENAEAYYGISRAYTEMKRYNSALDNLKRALDIKPGYVDAWNSLGYVYEMLNQYQAAIAPLKQAIGFDPNNTLAYHNLAWAYHTLKNYDEAIKNYEKAIETDMHYESAYFNLALAYMQSGDRISALKTQAKLKELNPEYAETLMKELNGNNTKPINDPTAEWDSHDFDMSDQTLTEGEELTFGSAAGRYILRVNKNTTQSIIFDLPDGMQKSPEMSAEVTLESINRTSSAGLALADPKDRYLALTVNRSGRWRIIRVASAGVNTSAEGSINGSGRLKLPCKLKIDMSTADRTFEAYINGDLVYSGSFDELSAPAIRTIQGPRLIVGPMDYKKDYSPPFEAFFSGNMSVKAMTSK